MVTATNTADSRAVPPLPEDAPRIRVGAPSYNPDHFAETTGHVTLIGSRRDCQLCVPLGDISKLHAAICNTGRELLIVDLRSRTGTFVNDQNVLAASLRRDDVVRIGNVPLELEFVRRPRGNDSGEKPKLAHPLRLSIGTQTFTLDTQPIVFGKRSNCDVVVDTPDVSLAHSLIFLVSGCPVVFDLGSRSGTLVNGRRVSLAWLKDGDRLGIGGETLTLGWDGPTYSPPPPAPPPVAAIPARAREADFDLAALMSGGGTPDTLEQTIAMLQGQLSGFRGRLDKRAAEIEQRAAELEAQAAESARQKAALEALREQLALRVEHTDQERRLVLRRRDKLRQAIEAYRKNRETLESQKAELDRAAAAVAADKQRIENLERELAARESAVVHSSAGLAQREQQLTDLEESLRKLERDLAEREQTFRLREQAIGQQEAALGQRERELQQRETAVEAARLAVSQLERDLKARNDDLLIREQELNDHQATLTALEEELLKRRAALEADEAALQTRREVVGESERRIQQLKSALERAAQAFSGMSLDAPPPEATVSIPGVAGGNGSTGPVTPGAKCASASDPTTEGRVMSTPGTGPQPMPAGPAAPIPALEARGNGGANYQPAPLPAPIVDQPIFAGLPTMQQLPLEMQERVRVLRRVSDRSEAELVAQVLAETDARQQSEATSAGKSKKKKRGWLS